jgi:hypothetical protein
VAERAAEITACGKDSAGKLFGIIEQGSFLQAFDDHKGLLI